MLTKFELGSSPYYNFNLVSRVVNEISTGKYLTLIEIINHLYTLINNSPPSVYCTWVDLPLLITVDGIDYKDFKIRLILWKDGKFDIQCDLTWIENQISNRTGISYPVKLEELDREFKKVKNNIIIAYV